MPFVVGFPYLPNLSTFQNLGTISSARCGNHSRKSKQLEESQMADPENRSPEDNSPEKPVQTGSESPAGLDPDFLFAGADRKFIAYTVKLPAEQLAALQSIWLELKRLYGSNSPDKSGMIQAAVTDWLKRWDGPDKQQLLRDLLEIRQDTRRRQYRKSP